MLRFQPASIRSCDFLFLGVCVCVCVDLLRKWIGFMTMELSKVCWNQGFARKLWRDFRLQPRLLFPFTAPAVHFLPNE